MCLTVGGRRVLISINNFRSTGTLSNPSGPSKTAQIAASSVSMETTTSTELAKAAGDGAALAPKLTK